MAKSAVNPVKLHPTEIRGHAGIYRPKGVILRTALSGMTSGTFLVGRGIMKPYAASIIGNNFKCRLVVTEFTLGIRTIGKCTVNRMAEHTAFSPRAMCSGDISMATEASTISDIRNTVQMVCWITFTPGRCACCMAVYTVTCVRHKTEFATNILEWRSICMTPDTCLVVAKNRKAVCWMT